MIKYGKNVKYLYIDIGYQFDVWGLDRKSTEEVSQELIFWLFENQEVEITYGDTPLVFTFTVPDTLIDNTDLVSYKTNGKLYRNTLNVQVSAVIMRSENYFNVLNPTVDVGVDNIKK